MQDISPEQLPGLLQMLQQMLAQQGGGQGLPPELQGLPPEILQSLTQGGSQGLPPEMLAQGVPQGMPQEVGLLTQLQQKYGIPA